MVIAGNHDGCTDTNFAGAAAAEDVVARLRRHCTYLQHDESTEVLGMRMCLDRRLLAVPPLTGRNPSTMGAWRHPAALNVCACAPPFPPDIDVFPFPLAAPWT